MMTEAGKIQGVAWAFGSLTGGLDQKAASQARAELAMDRLRDKYGVGAIGKGRSLAKPAKGTKDG